MLPFLIVRYEGIVGAYLGETASRLSKLFEYVKTRKCVLFFDEFETLGKERGDVHETGEIKRVVSSLLLHIENRRKNAHGDKTERMVQKQVYINFWRRYYP